MRDVFKHQNDTRIGCLITDTFDIAVICQLQDITRFAAREQILHPCADVVQVIMRKQALFGTIAQQDFQPAPTQFGMFSNLEQRFRLVIDDRNALLCVEHQQALRHVVERRIKPAGNNRQAAFSHHSCEKKFAKPVSHLNIGQEVWDQQETNHNVKGSPRKDKPRKHRDQSAGRHQNHGFCRGIIATNDRYDRSQKDGQAGQFCKRVAQNIA